MCLPRRVAARKNQADTDDAPEIHLLVVLRRAGFNLSLVFLHKVALFVASLETVSGSRFHGGHGLPEA
jgi:hypothetical protein